MKQTGGPGVSDLIEKVFRSTFGDDAWQRHLGCEQNYKEDCEKFAAMTNEQLAESAAYFLSQMQRCDWPGAARSMTRPELIKRLRD